MLNVHDLIVSQPDYFQQLSVKDLLFAHYHCPQQECLLNVYTHYNYIVYTLSGKRIIHRPEQSWLLTEGVSLFVKKGAFTQEKFYGVGWCVLVFFIPDNYLQQFFKEYRSQIAAAKPMPASTSQIIDIDINETTHAFFYSMLPYFSQQPKPDERLLELKFRELLYNILSNPNNTSLLSYVNTMSDCSKPPLEEIMESNYLYNLSLAEYAKIAHRSLATFKREFIEIFNTTPGKWLTQKRLNYAQLLLNTSQKNVNEIAYDSGFENTTHFSRIFKEKFGISPLQYRKQNVIAEDVYDKQEIKL